MTRYWINGNTSVELTEAEDVNIVHLSVDDKDIIVSAGQTIFEALQRMPGIGEIPALCYNPAVRPYGACRLCTVEVSEDRGKSFRFVAACLFPATDGLIIRTNTEKVRKLRKGIIELLLARSPNTKVVQELAKSTASRSRASHSATTTASSAGCACGPARKSSGSPPSAWSTAASTRRWPPPSTPMRSPRGASAAGTAPMSARRAPLPWGRKASRSCPG